jgi:hypothetical protein
LFDASQIAELLEMRLEELAAALGKARGQLQASLRGAEVGNSLSTV